jgi:glycosyltransferase involved in cell wall biosynthesis
LFPYRSDASNMVYGASGATRIAMACNIPVVVSRGHQFDDLEGILPRASNYEELALEIDKVFSNEEHRKSIIAKSKKYIDENTWTTVADKYLEIYNNVLPVAGPEII